jgi:hypothetical protein
MTFLRIARILLIAVILVAGALLVSELACKQKYAIDIHFARTANPAYPFVATGSVTGCGIRRLEGENRFRFMLRPGARPSGMQTTRGPSLVKVETAVAADGRSGWYVATVTRGTKELARAQATVQLP